MNRLFPTFRIRGGPSPSDVKFSMAAPGDEEPKELDRVSGFTLTGDAHSALKVTFHQYVEVDVETVVVEGGETFKLVVKIERVREIRGGVQVVDYETIGAAEDASLPAALRTIAKQLEDQDWKP